MQGNKDSEQLPLPILNPVLLFPPQDFSSTFYSPLRFF